MGGLDKTTFRKLLQECGSIRIPEIQRDYAQGRTNELATGIREGFFAALLPVLQGAEQEVSLDFVYGYRKKDAFEPLDGQQRLTTLFILHWLFLPIGNNDLVTIGSTPNETSSKFRYATRKSSGDFCDALVRQSGGALVDLWKKSNEKEQDASKHMSFSTFIKGLAWFEWTWRYDPTVSAMLNMANCVLEILQRYAIDFKSVQYDYLEHIVFHRLDLNAATVGRFGLSSGFELGEELYVKMNARGKELSGFDKLKSSLEEEIQLQKEEKRVDDKLERRWRSRMDGLWTDYFWKNTITRGLNIPQQEEVDKVEVYFKRFLSRVIAFELLKAIRAEESCQVEMATYRKELIDLCASVNDNKIETVVDKYVVAIRYARQKQFAFPRIDFGDICFLLDNLIVEEHNGGIVDVTQIAFPGFRWGPDDEDNKSLLWEFVRNELSHDRRVEFFTITLFARTMANSESFPRGHELCEDFQEWIRFVRNCSMLQNQQATRIDGFEEEMKACAFFAEWMRRFSTMKKNAALEHRALSFRAFLANLPSDLVRSGVDATCVAEEEIKAKLRQDSSWKNDLDIAENNSYLWGQLCALLNWSKTENGYDECLFKKYRDKVCDLFPVRTNELKDKLWKALLCLRDYRFSVAHCQTLITFDDNRDVSWKRYMREQSENTGINAPILKELIDLWDSEKYRGCERWTTFLDCVIADRGPLITDWRKFVIFGDKLSSECCQARGILVDDNKTDITGHKWFIPKTQIAGNSRRSYDVFLSYLWYCKKCIGVSADQFYDSIEPGADKKNSVIIKNGGYCVQIQAIPNGLYTYADSDGATQMNAEQVVLRLIEKDLLPAQ